MILDSLLTHPIDSSFARIYKDRVVHIHDDDDILFSGRNVYGNTIIGSFYDKKRSVRTYLHNIVSWQNAKKYFDGEISYNALIKSALITIYYTVDLEGGLEKSFVINKAEIENSHMPLEDSFFYDEMQDETGKIDGARKIVFQLNGKESDAGRIDFKKSTFIEKPILSIFNNIQLLPGINDLGTSVHFYSLPRMNGTFQFNYQMDFLFTNPDINRPLTSLLGEQYIGLLLSNERNSIKNAFYNPSVAPVGKFAEMISTVEEIYRYANKEFVEPQLIKDLAKKSYDGIENIAELSTEAYRGRAYSSISVSSGIGISLSELGQVTADDRLEIDESFSEAHALTDDYIDDLDYQEFFVEIIAMDRTRRNGRVELKEEPFIGQVCRFKIEGNESLKESKYTASLDHHSDIKIIAKAKRFRSNRFKIKLLSIQFESNTQLSLDSRPLALTSE